MNRREHCMARLLEDEVDDRGLDGAGLVALLRSAEGRGDEALAGAPVDEEGLYDAAWERGLRRLTLRDAGGKCGACPEYDQVARWCHRWEEQRKPLEPRCEAMSGR